MPIIIAYITGKRLYMENRLKITLVGSSKSYSRRRRFTVKQKSHTGGSRKHVTFILSSSFCMTFVWLFGALVRVCAIDYDPQENFMTWLYMERYSKKYFMSVHHRGMVDPAPALWLDRAKTRFGGTLGRSLSASDW